MDVEQSTKIHKGLVALVFEQRVMSSESYI